MVTQLVGRSSFFQTLALAFANALLFLAFLCFQLFRQFSHKNIWGANDPSIMKSEEYPRMRRIRHAVSKKRTLDPTTSSTTPKQSPSDIGESNIPQALPESIPQALPEPVPQAFPESISQVLLKPVPPALPEPVPQALPESISQVFLEPVPQVLSQPIPQASPQSIPQVLHQALHQSNARPGEEDEKPKLGFSVAIGIFAFAFLVC